MGPEGIIIAGEGSGPVEMTPEESLMSQEVEEYSDEMKRESDDVLRENLGKTSIAFFNIDQMGAGAKFVILCIIVAIFGAIGYFFHKELVVGQPDFNEIRKEEIRARKEKKKSK